jgi:hypothetical protein
MAGGNTNSDFSIPPYYGLPKEQPIKKTSSTPSNMWLVRIDDNNEELEKLRIQTVPLEINVNPEANWAVIPSLGRNNPFYHYTGGEDTIEFTLDWYSTDKFKEDVVRNCRWVESLSRSDGYRQEPSRVILVFGDLFKYTKWIVTSAKYRLSLFDRGNAMLPTQAYQDLVLRKVTFDNSTILDRRAIN